MADRQSSCDEEWGIGWCFLFRDGLHGIPVRVRMKFFRKVSEIMPVFSRFSSFCKALSILAMAGSMALAHAEGLPKFKQGEDYAKVRSKLLHAGWKPRRMPDADECSRGDERCQGRPEMEACSGVEKANCRFAWQRAGKLLTIFTIGSPAVFEAASNE